MLKESLEASASIDIPALSNLLEFDLILPERESSSFLAMAGLLPGKVYSADAAFFVPRGQEIGVEGKSAPGASVVVVVNGVTQTNPPVMADSSGHWSASVILGPGQNTIQAESTP